MNASLTVVASLGLVLAALYSLRMMQKVFLGPTFITTKLKDFNARELITMSALSMSIVVLGLYPQPVIDMVKGVIQQVVVK